MLGRLRITQRLSLLLMLPLAAVLLTSVPFTVERVDDARAAAAIVDSANNARSVGAVVQELQQERLLALGYLASTRLHRSTLVAQMESSRDFGAQARAALRQSVPPELIAALTGLATLDALRQSVLRHAVSVTEVHRAYHDAVLSLVNALRLADQPKADAVGLRQMASLDALLRTNEEANQIGAALVVAAVDPASGATIVSGALPLEQVHLERFRQLGEAQHVALFALGADGPSGKRAAALTTTLAAAALPVAVEDGLSVAQAGIAIRRGLQERIVSDIAARASGRATEAKAAAGAVGGFAAGLLVVVIWLGAAVSRSVAWPLRRVTVAATAVADLASRELVRVTDVESDDHRPPRLAAVTLRSADEIGELASAFNRVQATAALMMEQQVTTRHNVGVMFANIAHRTGSLVARQLAQIDELERDEHDEQRLAKLYRLDHLTTRLRRSADSLMVIAGSREDARIASPMPLADVIRSAIAEIEGYQNVRLGMVGDVTVVAAVVPDLTLLLAELLENATAFSPPDVPVEVYAGIQASGLIQIVDRGIGMTAERLAQENSRLVSRERLDIAPTTMLGLLVVGRLARRHGLTVRLLQTPVTGVTAEIIMPAELFLWGSPTGAERGPAPTAQRPAIRGGPAPVAAIMAEGPDFGWFDPPGAGAAPGGQGYPGPHRGTVVMGQPNGNAPVNGSLLEAAEPTRAGLRRRQPGASQTDIDLPGARPSTGGAHRDPDAERAGLDAFAQGTARAAMSAPADTADRSRGGLQRRRPGEHLAETLRAETADPRSPRRAGADAPLGVARDPEAERDALNLFLNGLARASDPHTPDRDN